jgi:hypothetical protein
MTCDQKRLGRPFTAATSALSVMQCYAFEAQFLFAQIAFMWAEWLRLDGGAA